MNSLAQRIIAKQTEEQRGQVVAPGSEEHQEALRRATGGASGANEGAEGNDGGEGGDDAQDLTDEQLNSILKKKYGKDFDISKFAKPADEDQPTEEEIARRRQKKVLDAFMADPENGSVEKFTEIQNVLKADPLELGRQAVRAELKAAGFEDDAIDGIIARRYFDGAGDGTYTEAEIKYGQERLKARGEAYRQEYAALLGKAESYVDAQEQLEKSNRTWKAEAEEVLGKIPEKLTFNIGTKEAPTMIDFEIDQQIRETLKDTLTDPKKALKSLMSKDGKTIDKEKLANLFLNQMVMEAAVITAYRNGTTAAIAGTEGRFSPSPIMPTRAATPGASAKVQQQQQQQQKKKGQPFFNPGKVVV